MNIDGLPITNPAVRRRGRPFGRAARPVAAAACLLAVLPGLLAGCSLKNLAYGAADAAGGKFLGAEKGVVFYSFDTLAYPRQSVDLACKLQSGKNLKDLDGATVAYSLGGEEIGRAKTDDEGRAVVSWKPPAEGDYRIEAKIVGGPRDEGYAACKGLASELVVSAREKAAEFVVIDLDHTVVDSSFYEVMMGDAVAMDQSVRVTRRIAGRWSILYLTHRPDLLTRRSKSWLRQNGYPVAPLLTSELMEAFGDSGKFKTARLQELRETFPNVRIGIGDKISDAQSYVDNGLTAYLIPYYKAKPKDMRKAADEIDAIRPREKLQVVDTWRQVEAGLFEGERFPPEPYVRDLRARAERLAAEEKARKKDDDDDDDDDD